MTYRVPLATAFTIDEVRREFTVYGWTLEELATKAVNVAQDFYGSNHFRITRLSVTQIPANTEGNETTTLRGVAETESWHW